MRIVGLLIWSAVCVGAGVFGGIHYGSTISEKAEHAWKARPAQVDKVTTQAGELVDEVKKKVKGEPSEHHSGTDREAVNQIISRHRG